MKSSPVSTRGAPSWPARRLAQMPPSTLVRGSYIPSAEDLVRRDIFSPFVLADRAAFALLTAYFLFWPIWYSSEDKLSARILDFRVEHLIVAIVLLLSLGTIARRRWSPTPGTIAFLLLICYSAVTLAWTINLKEGALVLLNFASVIVFVQVLASNPQRQTIARLSFLSGLIVMSAVGIGRAEAPTAGDFRFLFPAGIDSNQLAVQTAIAVVMLASIAVVNSEGRLRHRIRFSLVVATIIVLSGIIILSGSRTGVLAAAAGCSVVLLVVRGESGRLRLRHRRLAWVPALALLGVLAAPALMDSNSATLLERYKAGFFRGDLDGRDMVWSAGGRYFASSARIVVVGGGLGSFDESVVSYLDTPLYKVAVHMAEVNPSRFSPYFAAHNDLLRIACDLGVVGLMLFVTFYAQVALGCIRIAGRDDSSKLPLALFVTVLVGGMGIDLVSFPAYPLILALIIAPCANLSGRSGDYLAKCACL